MGVGRPGRLFNVNCAVVVVITVIIIGGMVIFDVKMFIFRGVVMELTCVVMVVVTARNCTVMLGFSSVPCKWVSCR